MRHPAPQIPYQIESTLNSVSMGFLESSHTGASYGPRDAGCSQLAVPATSTQPRRTPDKRDLIKVSCPTLRPLNPKP